VNIRFSVIIPVYNRPEEIDELLESLTIQTFSDFEVLIVEDGSDIKCEHIVEKYVHDLDITYCFKENEGQGFARNHGFSRAKGDYFIVFDSDCIIPPAYFENVNNSLSNHYLDAYGGPDKAHPSFTPVQKAISFSMTSFFTTGGIRGNKSSLEKFKPRSFNMGISKKVFKATGGYIIPYKGEDIEFSLRINKMGFKIGLIEDAYVYHKRRTSWVQFYKQLHFFGTARININRFFPGQLKIVHAFPAFFTIGLVLTLLSFMVSPVLAQILSFIYGLYFILIFFDALFKTQSIKISFLGVLATFIQLTAYGTGFIEEGLAVLFSFKNKS